MKKKPLFSSLLVLLLIGLLSSQANAQEVEYNSFEDLMYDISNRQVERPIAYISSAITVIESGEVSFDDDEYVGLVLLLSNCFNVNDETYKADSILSHAIDFMQNIGRTSRSFGIHFGYGSLLMTLENYVSAAQHLELFINEERRLNMIDESFAVVLSMLARCHMNTSQLDLAVREIEEALAILDSIETVSEQTSTYHASNLMRVYSEAGNIYYEYEDYEHAMEYAQKAYELIKDDETNVYAYLFTIFTLATLYMNNGNYTDGLALLHRIENKPMSEHEREQIYLDIFLAYYYLDREEECVKYAQLCSSSIIKNTQQYYTSFPGTTIEDIWQTSAIQLRLNMGVLDKFPHNIEAARMSYDNALFTKQLLYERMSYLRDIAKTDIAIDSTIRDIKNLRAELFGGDRTIFETLNQKEKNIIEQLNSKKGTSSIKMRHWQDIREALNEDEYAIEFISYTGWPKNVNEKKPVRIGALILSHDAVAPRFVDICTNDSLWFLVADAYSQQEIGINELYTIEGGIPLYNLVWAPLEPIVKSAKRIYYSPILNLQLINLGFVPCPDGTLLHDRHDLYVVSSTAVICDKIEKSSNLNASLYGGINYSSKTNDQPPTVIRGLLDGLKDSDDRGSFGYLSASNREVDELNSILSQHHYSTNLLKGNAADESSFRELDGNSPSILHLSTHGFYLVGFYEFSEYFERLVPYSQIDSDMTKSGLLLADANTSLNTNSSPVLIDGVLTAEEISWMDFSNTRLVVLSACETAVGHNIKEGWGGLPRAFKMAGVQHIVASLWKVSDEVTADLMILFYKNLLSGMEPHESLIRAQHEMSLRYPDPYYWAAFIMID